MPWCIGSARLPAGRYHPDTDVTADGLGAGALVRRHTVAVRAVFLSGPGGAGKTTIGKRVQQLLAENWLFFEVDKCAPHVAPTSGFATAKDEQRMVRATLRAAYAYVAEGFPTLIEMDLSSPWRRSACKDTFRSVPILFIVLTARREVAMSRVAGRGTTPEWLHWFERNYDSVNWDELPGTVRIDTSDTTLEEVTGQVVWLIEC